MNGEKKQCEHITDTTKGSAPRLILGERKNRIQNQRAHGEFEKFVVNKSANFHFNNGRNATIKTIPTHPHTYGQQANETNEIDKHVIKI